MSLAKCQNCTDHSFLRSPDSVPFELREVLGVIPLVTPQFSRKMSGSPENLSGGV